MLSPPDPSPIYKILDQLLCWIIQNLRMMLTYVNFFVHYICWTHLKLMHLQSQIDLTEFRLETGLLGIGLTGCVQIRSCPIREINLRNELGPLSDHAEMKNSKPVQIQLNSVQLHGLSNLKFKFTLIEYAIVSMHVLSQSRTKGVSSGTLSRSNVLESMQYPCRYQLCVFCNPLIFIFLSFHKVWLC